MTTRAFRRGALFVNDASWPVSEDGTGASAVELDRGCHEIHLFAPDAPSAARSAVRLDVDAELWDEETGRLLSRDRSDALDALLTTCVGEPIKATAIFAGARYTDGVTVSHASWALPPELPTLWGAAVQGRMATVLHARAVTVKGAPIFLAQGPSGSTRIPVPVQAGDCYVLVATSLEGTVHALSLRVESGSRESRDDGAQTSDSAVATAICVGAPHRVVAEIDARGVGMAWGLAVFRARSGTWQ